MAFHSIIDLWRIPVATAALSLGVATTPQAEAAPPQRLAPALPNYALADRLVALPDGRRINMVCTGQGTPTVVLIAGLGLWSYDWRKVQAPLSTTMRVCSWDRAGYGHSDAARRAVTLASSERDLEGALHAAGVAPPYIIVGHSIGGIEARLFAARNPRAVAGMVLVDPTVADQTQSMARVAPGLARLVGDEGPVRACLKASMNGTMTGKQAAGCIDPPGADAFPALRAAWLRLAGRPSSFAGDLTMDRSLPDAARLLAQEERPFGNRPVIVLTAGKSPPVPAALRTQARAWTIYWRRDHQRLAQLSRRGEERLVPGASHTIEQDDPAAVVKAIRDVAGGVP